MTGNLDWFEQEAQANDARLQEAGAVIMSFTELTGPKTRKDFARKILSTANLAINMLDFVANVHPVAKGVVSMFKTIVQMEIQRSHNDPRIVAIHHMMTQSVCTIRYLTMRKIVKDLERKLKSHLGDLRKIFKEFSEFTSLYYSHRQAIFRILRAEEFKIRLKSFSTKLKESQDALQLLIVADNAKKLASIEGKIDDLSSNVAKLVETLGRDGVNEKKAAQLVRDLGGPREVLKEASKLDRVAEILHQPLNDDIQVALQKSLRELQESNKEQFKKLFAKMDSSLTNKRILQQLKKGGQWGKLISDDDISHLWSKLEWKSSVEVRLLLEELRRHFEIKFFDYHTKEEQVHQDHWTLSILCKVVHHSMISDVIDEDSSGFISVEETNRFLSREPSHWRMPQRLCFWARGWAETNDEYRELIQERLEDIRIDAKKMDKSNHSLRGFLDLIPPLVTALTVDTEDGERSTHSDDTDDDRDPVPELSILKYEYQRSQESRIKEILSSVPVDSRSSLLEVIGQPRIELSLMPLIYVWLEKLRDVVKQSRTHRVDRNHLKNFLFKPLMVILEVFTARMRELTRLWRQQHMSEALQIRCFCGGIFAPWYAELLKPNNIWKKVSTLGKGKQDADADANAALRLAGIGLEDKLQNMWIRINARLETLDSRLAVMENRLEVMSTSTETSPSQHRHTKDIRHTNASAFQQDLQDILEAERRAGDAFDASDSDTKDATDEHIEDISEGGSTGEEGDSGNETLGDEPEDDDDDQGYEDGDWGYDTEEDQESDGL